METNKSLRPGLGRASVERDIQTLKRWWQFINDNHFYYQRKSFLASHTNSVKTFEFNGRGSKGRDPIKKRDKGAPPLSDLTPSAQEIVVDTGELHGGGVIRNVFLQAADRIVHIEQQTALRVLTH